MLCNKIVIFLIVLLGVSHGVIHGQVEKNRLSHSNAQYYCRENGSLDIKFILDRSGSPMFGLADIASITSPEVVRLLDINENSLKKLRQVEQEFLETIDQNKKEKQILYAAEIAYAKAVLENLDAKQIESWNWWNERNVFFSAGVVEFLSSPEIVKKLEISENQLQQIESKRIEDAQWLREQTNVSVSEHHCRQVV